MLTKEQVLSIADMVKKGMTNGEIAAKLGLHTSTVIRWKQRSRDFGEDVPL